MFYWSGHGAHVVLTDREEEALIAAISTGPEERVGYLVSPEVRARLEKRAFRFLAAAQRSDPEGFARTYVQKHGRGADAYELAGLLLDAFGRITKRAAPGHHGKPELGDVAGALEGFMDAVPGAGPQFRFTIFGRRPWYRTWLGLLPSPTAFVSVPVSEIEEVFGGPDNFFVATSTLSIRFHRDFIRVTSIPARSRPVDAIA